MINVGINGAAGQMGKRLIDLVAKDEKVTLVCALESPEHRALGKDAGNIAGGQKADVDVSTEINPEADVLIDFSTPDASLVRVEECAEKEVAVVIGTTGFDLEQEEKIEEFASEIGIVMAPNMSLGVNLLFALAEKVAGALGEAYDPEIVEAHHRHKKDAPSGTAGKLAENICEGLSWKPAEEHIVNGREGNTGERPKRQVGVHAVRGGEIVGDHTVIFAGTGERIELAHKAGSRDVFARGALQAAQFVVSQNPGLYTMADVLGL